MKSIPPWARCINCKVQARNGVINHGKTCPEFTSSTASSLFRATLNLAELRRRVINT